MPRTALPPTPASSTDIAGQDGTQQLQQLQITFELPPPAINSRPRVQTTGNVDTPVSPESQASPKTPYPIQPSETVKSRRRSSVAATAANKDNNNNFVLPPPPTRSRKIIQMKPRSQQDEKRSVEKASGKGAVSSMKKAAATPTTIEAAALGPAKKKQPSTTTGAAGRKMARKTAHSLIERRRRSKMNEEFSVLKDMIPACTGEMHKLAILQASIDYVRYLHDCIEKLEAQRGVGPQAPTDVSGMPTPSGGGESYEGNGEHHSPDVEMTGSDATPSPTFTVQPSPSTSMSSTSTIATYYYQQPSASPALAAKECQEYPARRHDSYSSASTAAADHHRRPYSYGGYMPSDHHSASGSMLTSPALSPLEGRRDLDQEATAALLMLNIDRRGTVSSMSEGVANTGGGGKGRGMSVRELLSA